MNDKPENPPAPPQQPYYVMMPAPSADDDEISLIDLWRTLAAHKWLIFTITFLFTAAATAYALLATPVYRAEVLAAPAQKADQPGRLGALAAQFGGLADLAGISLPGSKNIESVIATLKSRQFITGFINDRNLKPILFHKGWDPEQQRWIVNDPSLIARLKRAVIPESKGATPESLAPGEPTTWDAYERFRDGILTVTNDSKTGLITVQVDWEDPLLAAEWANALVDRVNAELRRQVIEESERAIQYLNHQIQQTSLADLRAILYRIIEEHTKNMTLAKVNDQYALNVIDPAVAPQQKIKPKRTLTVALGFVLGLMIGIFGAFLRNVIRQQHRASQTTDTSMRVEPGER